MLDLDLDQFQLVGQIPVAVVQTLWPGFVPQDHDVYVNPVYLRRHLQSRPDYVNRVAAFNQYGHLLESCFAEAGTYARYDRVSGDEAGLDVFSRVEVRREPAFVQIGVRLATASSGAAQTQLRGDDDARVNAAGARNLAQSAALSTMSSQAGALTCRRLGYTAEDVAGEVESLSSTTYPRWCSLRARRSCVHK